MTPTRLCLLMGLALPAVVNAGLPVTPEFTNAMAECQRWSAAKFEGMRQPGATEPGLIVQTTGIGGVEKNSRNGKPMIICDKLFARGLFCRPESRILVRLPGPGQSFTATVGLDSNERTRRIDLTSRADARFIVKVGDKEACRTDLMKERSVGHPVVVDLAGATEFTLETLADQPDEIGIKDGDWADARVTLADGRQIWLDELPFVDAPAEYTTDPPFSFTYDGQPSAALLGTWTRETSERKLDETRNERTLIWRDQKTGLQVRCVAVEYADFPTVEWTVYLKNTGSLDTPILEHIQALDASFQRGGQPEFILHHHTGGDATPGAYTPHETPLPPKAEKRISTAGGRPSNSDLPFFNIAWPGRGVIMAIGWPGQWAAAFTRDEARAVRLRAGQELTRFKLLPGEEVRTPLIALQFWRGDRIDAQNIWRRWMLAHNTPRPAGQPVPPMLMALNTSVDGDRWNWQASTEENQIHGIDAYADHGIRLDGWWIDAGWYVYKGGWGYTGTWEVDRQRYPHGLRAVADHARDKGIPHTFAWFEPERVMPGTWLAENHPEWLLKLDKSEVMLLNLGDPAARQWITGHIDRLMTEEHLTIYRQDFNMDPLDHWRAHDTPDRQGITEIQYVTGQLAFWDELQRRRPGMLIDNCASGGRRNDLEILRRSIPFVRTDWFFEYTTDPQCHTYGMASWMPCQGSFYMMDDDYGFRSSLTPYMAIVMDLTLPDLDYTRLRRQADQWRQVAPYLLGDYYPLTPYTQAQDTWLAWQFDRPDLGGGMVQAFRREQAGLFPSIRLRLRGLDPTASYRVTNLDETDSRTVTGKELLEQGLTVELPVKPAGALIVYQKI